MIKERIINFIADLPHRPTRTEFPTGITRLDKMAWFSRQTLNIVAARPSNCKSSFALNCLAVPTAESGKTVFIFTLEDREERFLLRFLANKTDTVNYRIKDNDLGQYEIDKLYDFRDKVADMPLFIVEDVGYKVEQIEKYIIDSKVKPDMVILDYINKIDTRNSDRLESINEYLRKFSMLTKKYNFCGVVLCQINRSAMGEGNTRAIHPPMLHHIKETGDIEQIADMVVLLHWKYKYTQDLMDKSTITIILAKNKDGDTGFLECRIDPEYNRITEFTGDVVITQKPEVKQYEMGVE